MKIFKTPSTFLAFFLLLISCSESDPLEPETAESSSKDLKNLVLDYNGTDYHTKIESTEVINSQQLPFLAEQVKIESFQISPGASINITTGQTLEVSNSPFVITVKAEDGSSQNYSLKISKDEGLQIEPNSSISSGSSYTLQSSDVYVDGNQLTKDFDRFFITAYADFNNDGDTDVLLAGGLFKSYEYSPIQLYLGDGTGVNADFCECGGACSANTCDSFTKQPNAIPDGHEGLQHPRKILVGDFNGDNLQDAFIIGHGYDADPFPGESPVLLLNNGNGFDYEKLNDVSGFFHGASSADFDNDGDLDIFIVGGPSDVETLFLINDGDGNFSKTSEYIDEDYHENSKIYTSEFIDINSDGYMDLLLGGHEFEGGETIILWGNSSGKFYKELSYTIPEVSGYGIVVDIDATDIDGDGDKDLIFNRVDSNDFYKNYHIQVVENENNTSFKDVTSSSIVNNSGNDWYIWVHLQDLNGDGISDIYLENDHRPNLKWFGDGNGNFNQ